jgi:hypothetical protein
MDISPDIYSNMDAGRRNCYANSNAYSNHDAYQETNCHADRNTDTDANAFSNGYCWRNANANRYTLPGHHQFVAQRDRRSRIYVGRLLYQQR